MGLESGSESVSGYVNINQPYIHSVLHPVPNHSVNNSTCYHRNKFKLCKQTLNIKTSCWMSPTGSRSVSADLYVLSGAWPPAVQRKQNILPSFVPIIRQITLFLTQFLIRKYLRVQSHLRFMQLYIELYEPFLHCKCNCNSWTNCKHECAHSVQYNELLND